MNKLHKSLLIGAGALVLSTVAIQASDLLRGVDGNLAGLAIQSEGGVCGEGATEILLGSHALCVDTYEESPSSACPVSDPKSGVDTQQNANESACVPESKEHAMPWRYVSLTQAQQFCARAGKRLPTNEEWYKAVSGITDAASCVIKGKSDPLPTGEASCVTPSGIHDMIGNVWEWMDGQVVNGNYDNRMLPQSGYVSLVDTNGVVVETEKSPAEEFGSDYAWTAPEGVMGIIRGGFYGSGDDAGLYAQNLSVPLDFKTAGVGFRCVKDL
jgi:formylglycine-generating enzyme required for sulfatase activity